MESETIVLGLAFTWEGGGGLSEPIPAPQELSVKSSNSLYSRSTKDFEVPQTIKHSTMTK